MELSNKKFELLENDDGLATGKTVMAFDSSTSPYRATYSGPNIVFGHALVAQEGEELVMLYHSLSNEGVLSAGKATVILRGGVEMQLNWQWVSGGSGSGISKWRKV